VHVAVFVNPQEGIDGIAMLKSITVGNPTIAERHHLKMNHFRIGTEVIKAAVGVEEVCLWITCLSMGDTDEALESHFSFTGRLT
jgi:hypothetical protein